MKSTFTVRLPEEDYEDIEGKVTVSYSDRTNSFYLSLYTSEPLDSYGANWGKVNECVVMTESEIKELIIALQKVLDK